MPMVMFACVEVRSPRRPRQVSAAENVPLFESPALRLSAPPTHQLGTGYVSKKDNRERGNAIVETLPPLFLRVRATPPQARRL